MTIPNNSNFVIPAQTLVGRALARHVGLKPDLQNSPRSGTKPSSCPLRGNDGFLEVF